MPLSLHLYLSLLEQQQHHTTQAMREHLAQRKQALANLRCQILAQHLHISPEAIQFAYHAQGKPFLHSEPSVAFNISHSKQVFALLLTEQRGVEIGVDIEQLDRNVRFDALAKHCFHDEEYALWQQQGATVAHWFKIWTVKEAVLKAHGLGIRLNLNSLNTQITLDSTHGKIEHEQLGQIAFQVFPYDIGQQKVMIAVAWCGECAELEPHSEIIIQQF
ncbi:MAG: 4'-phosphopantetheinyl transferase superfamily protein [Acinetobacter sp.]|nr:4'-phosphopantetheinyl transferase superfamily protein [Acinetobacter sp.]